VFESEKQPLFDGLGHFSFITRSGHTAQAADGDSPATYFFCARNLAHRAFVAFEIFALAAADNTRFLT